MAGSLNCLIFLCLFVFVLSKELHLKQNLVSKDKDAKGFMNLFDEDDIFTKHERVARHIEAVTESVIEHLMNEIKQQYFNTNYNSKSPISRLIRNLTKEMKRNERSKMLKEKEKRKHVNKKKNKIGKNKRKLTTTKANL